MMPRNAIIFIAACALNAAASSQSPFQTPHSTGPASAQHCPTPDNVNHLHLHGTWTAQVQPDKAPVVIRLGPHPELKESVRGSVERAGETAQASGDIDDGDLTLEESVNGTNISSTWTGRVVDGSCGKEIRGTWSSATAPDTLRPFTLRKQASWQ